MRLTLWPVAVTFLGLALCAQAGPRQQNDATHRYRWVDSTGLLHFSDSLNHEALSRGYDVFDASGRIVRHVPGQDPATPAGTSQEQTQAQTAQQQQQRDRQLLTAYPTEADFKAAQQARLDDLDRSMQTIRMNLKSQEDNLANLLARAAGFSNQDQDVPASLQQRIDRQRAAVAEQQQRLQRQQARKSKASRQAATELARYRALRARQQARYSH